MRISDHVTNALNSSEKDGASETSDESASGGPFDVPESAVEDMVNVSKRIEIITEHYDDVTAPQARTIAETLKEHIEDSEGNSRGAVKRELEDEIGLDEELVETVVWTELSSIHIIDRVEGYLDRRRDGDAYKIVVSDDGHEICVEARDEIEARDGVSLEDLTRILLEKSESHPDGTPDRMEHWVPHERCKASIVWHITE